MGIRFIEEGLRAAGGIIGGEDGKKIDDALNLIRRKADQDLQIDRKLTGAENKLREQALEADFPFRRYARPTFLYVLYLVILVNFAIIPMFQAAGVFGAAGEFPGLPDAIYWLFGTAYLGYAGFRSMDKRGLLNSLK